MFKPVMLLIGARLQQAQVTKSFFILDFIFCKQKNFFSLTASGWGFSISFSRKICLLSHLLLHFRISSERLFIEQNTQDTSATLYLG